MMWMKQNLMMSLLILTSLSLIASPQTDYLTRFQMYLDFQKHFPVSPTPVFIQFIKQKTPLANQLRHRWLIDLGQKKDWKTFRKYYQKTDEVTLNCYAALAEYYLGQKTIALNQARSLWLSAHSQPYACNELFDILITSPNFDERYLDARLILALNHQHPEIIPYILKLYKPPRFNTLKKFEAIQKDPTILHILPQDAFHGYFYVYGLKRLVAQHHPKVWMYWHLAKTQHRLTEAQQQQFIAYVALDKALNNEKDAQTWFNKIKPPYYNDILLEAQIRLALQQLNWKRIEKLTRYYQDQSDLSSQYWRARALAAQGKQAEARIIYTTLSKNRHYYGFLASQRLQHPLHFEYEEGAVNLYTLQVYAPITQKVAWLRSHHPAEAVQLLHDFISELPQADQITLIHWVGNVLKWTSQSIALTNQLDLKNHLVLRFPLAYQDLISYMAKKYHLPEALIYAIIRQESAFREDIVSHAGATGLMQLMPTTAKMVAQSQSVPYHSPQQLFHIPTNLHLGSAYLQTLSKQFHQHPVLMAAAYNAGPGQVIRWLKTLPQHDIDLWIETIPWQETRNYLKNIIAFYAIYEYRLREKTNLTQILKPLHM